MICKHCEKETRDDGIYCVECGGKLQEDEVKEEKKKSKLFLYFCFFCLVLFIIAICKNF